MSEATVQPALPQVGKALNLIPVGSVSPSPPVLSGSSYHDTISSCPTGAEMKKKQANFVDKRLKEAALDSPTFRATAVHFSDQVEIIEKWLDAYTKSVSKLDHDVIALEETFNSFLLRSVPPANVSEAVLDHDYTLLAMKRFGETTRDWWAQVLSTMRKMETNVVEPIKAFMTGELRNFKDARRYLEQSQKTFDATLARYVGQSKTKELSSLREDAFQVHETRKAYLKASLDFCLLAPQLRYTMDKLLVRVSSDQWREIKRAREVGGINIAKWNGEMNRVRGWSKEMEAGERVFRRELQFARREIAETASQASMPSRELEDYNLSTVAYLGSKGPSNVNIKSQGKEGEKQGWLFIRTMSGKPARTVWVRRWFYVKNGIFGWLVQGAYSGGVEESDKIGVLLCNVKPAVQEERRFCFEVKTKNQTILVQAETQGQLMEWLGAFETAKKKALEASTSDNYPHPGGIDPAFAITPASVPEFSVKSSDGHVAHGHGADDPAATGSEKSGSLPVPGAEGGNFIPRASVDAPRRSATTREEGESSRDHAARIMQKLDLRKPSMAAAAEGLSGGSPASGGGIASLISASHNILPVHSTPSIVQAGWTNFKPQTTPFPVFETHTSTLAPSTLTNPPAATNLSKTAVIVSGERGIGVGRSDATGGMPSGIMANMWGSSNWGYINRLQRGEIKPSDSTTLSVPPSPTLPPLQAPALNEGDDSHKPDSGSTDLLNPTINVSTVDPVVKLAHRKTISADADATRLQNQPAPKPEVFPGNYPLELKTQEAQFRILFPNVTRSDKLLLVFRATWNPSEQQEFPGRVYVTRNDIYFYSHHLGLVLISGVSLDAITEVTAAPGDDCDFIFLHLRDDVPNQFFNRITIKTFLEPLRLLHSRLDFLVDISQSEKQMSLEDIMTSLIDLENQEPTRTPSTESWEDISVNTPIDTGISAGRARNDRDLKAAVYVDRGLHLGKKNKEITKFHLPANPVEYEPEGMQRKVVERDFEISPKALFHVMFGDKSAVFQLLYNERRAQRISQGPWVPVEGGNMRRDFEFQIDYLDIFGRSLQANVVDSQIIDVMNDHVCYVITDRKTPWHLPHHKDFMLVSKIIITHVAKSKCRLAIYTKIEWSKQHISKSLIERQALDDCGLDALDLADVIADQVRKLGPQSRTKKAIHIFGYIGQQKSVALFPGAQAGLSKRPQIKQRTLTHMLLETLRSFGESAISSLMMWTFAAIRTLWKVMSAHSIILIVLLISMLMNAFFTSRDTSDWWAERNAAKFMSRIGVGPNTMMSKAIYLKDLDEALTSLPGELVGDSDSKCLAHFREIANATDMNAPYEITGAPFLEAATRSTAKRLRRTRQHLGSYRHNLVVAMRMVNSVEREMLQAEWENWLLDENSRCRHVEEMLRVNHSNTVQGRGAKESGSHKVPSAHLQDKDARLDELREWQAGYCNSCKLEHDKLLEGGERLSFV